MKQKKAQVVIAAQDNKDSFVFLILQTNQKRGEFWQNVTGKLEDDESFEEGALREAMEETGLQIESIVDIINLGLSYHFIDQRKRDIHEESFLFIVDKKWDVKLDPHEHRAFKWVTFSEINEDLVKYESNYAPLVKAKHLLEHWGA